MWISNGNFQAIYVIQLQFKNSSDAVKMYILWNKTCIFKLWHEVIAETKLYFDDDSKQYTRQLRGILLHCFIPRVNAHQSFWLSQREKNKNNKGMETFPIIICRK